MPKSKKIKCGQCGEASCCKTGAWADLEEAKQIASLGLKGEFSQLRKDDSFPSGFGIGTSYGFDPCSFLDPDGLCSIHKVDYALKPEACKEFPYEGKKISPHVELCGLYNKKKAAGRKNRRRAK